MLAHQFKIQRERCGFSTALIAQKLGVNERTVQRWESGDVEITSERAEDFERILCDLETHCDKTIELIYKQKVDEIAIVSYERDVDMWPEDLEFFGNSKVHRACLGMISDMTELRLIPVRFEAQKYQNWLQGKKDSRKLRAAWAAKQI